MRKSTPYDEAVHSPPAQASSAAHESHLGTMRDEGRLGGGDNDRRSDCARAWR